MSGCRTKATPTGSLTACRNLVAVVTEVVAASKNESSRVREKFAAQFLPGATVDRADHVLGGRPRPSIRVRGGGAGGPFEARMVVVPAGPRRLRLFTCTERELPPDAADARCGAILEQLAKGTKQRSGRRP